jgi:acetyl-CoA decarbonylase/synthase complex subunit alpha
LTRKNVRLKIGEMKTKAGLIKNHELSVGKLVDDSWEEPMGPTPMPDLTTLRSWDMILLNRYKPFYMPACDL